MTTFSELPIFVEHLINQASTDPTSDLSDKAETALAECLQLLTLLNKTAFYAADNESADISTSDLAEATTSLSELTRILAQICSQK
ncbi:hypothetical protein ACMXYR_14905 [Neptuniibacter sp. QD29_5]|uniref:hypothetical protein n=1 Tax=Neptuniibacter sp. QD29_5 TaxID=3398207 RepID=UPI0039F5DBFE